MNLQRDDFPSIEECVYTSYYCEENIWKLCQSLLNRSADCLQQCYCVFVSNDSKITPLWQQKAGSGEDYFVAWDYHVFLVRKTAYRVLVYDFDTTLGFPVDFMTYINKSIGSENNLAPQYFRYFRVIPSIEYLHHFSSDRRHMKNANGEWLQPPPPYPPIQSNEAEHNLNDFISMKLKEGPGIVMNLESFIKYFTS